MPWTKDNPPSVAKNWTEAEQARCISAANAVLREGGTEQSAIFACIKNAGKTKRPSGKQDAKGGLALEPVTADDIAQYSNHALFANTEPGALLKFKGAVLCTTGENVNRDWIDETGIKELADTMPFRAIDNEHNATEVIGFFVNPRAEDNNTKLVTDGIIYNDRFPEIVAQVQSGVKKLSVEAGAQKAVCSVCGGEFASTKDYCSHLRDKTAVRKLYGLKAKGGATVFHPAWDTSFDANGFVMIASQADFGQPKTDVERAKTHFKLSDEQWNALSDVQKKDHFSKLPPVGTKRANEAEASLWERIEGKLDTYLQMFKPVLLEDVELSGDMAAVELLSLALEAAKKKKWSKDVDLKEGSLSALGWPNYNKLAQAVRSGKVSYATLIRKLAFLRNVTKDSATKSKAASFMERLKNTFRKNKTKGGVQMSEINVDELNLEELGLVQASDLEALKVDLEAKLAEKDTEAEKLKIGFARVLEMDMEASQLEILADMSEDAYQLLKAQQKPKEEVKKEIEVKAAEKKPEDETKPGGLQGAVLEAGDKAEATPLTWNTYSGILKLGGE